MSAQLVVEFKREADEVVAVARDHSASFCCRSVKLLKVDQPFGAILVDADSVETTLTQDFSDMLTQILVQVKFQERACVKAGCEAASFSELQLSLRAVCRSISSA